MSVEHVASAEGTNCFRALTSGLRAKILADLPLREIERDRIIFSTRTESGRLTLEDTLGHLSVTDPLAATAIRMTGDQRAPFQRLASVVRDGGVPAPHEARTWADLEDPAFFKLVLKHAHGNDGMLAKLIAAWALLPRDARTATAATLQESITSKPELGRAFAARKAWFARIHDATPEELAHLAERTDGTEDPGLRAQEHVALRQAANGNPTVLEHLAEHTDRIADPTLRAHEHVVLRRAANGNPAVLWALPWWPERIVEWLVGARRRRRA